MSTTLRRAPYKTAACEENYKLGDYFCLYFVKYVTEKAFRIKVIDISESCFMSGTDAFS
jgi:hypothetical protein